MVVKSGCWAEISLDNIENNLNEIKSKIDENTKVCCVIKANAYGSGSVEVAKHLEDKNVDFFAVARIEEGLELRANNIKTPILCLGYIDLANVEKAIENDISITVYNEEYIKEVDKIASKLNKKAKVHIKLDTGMSRIGFVAENATSSIVDISNLKHIYIEGIFTHFAKADETDKTTTLTQIDRYKKVINELEEKNINIPIKHVSNSAGILDINSPFNMVRAGIILYGYYPSDEVNKDINLKPCLKLKSAVTNVKVVDENVGISYGHVYKTTEKCKIVTISVGYADGFNRVQHNPKVSINGQILDIVGRICMDQCMAKAPLDMEVNVEDEVTLIDNDIEQLTLEENAKRNDTINYEILCMINRRVERIYTNKDKTYKVNYLV